MDNDVLYKLTVLVPVFNEAESLSRLHHELNQRLQGKAQYNLGNRLVDPFIETLAFRWMQEHFIQYDIDKASVHERLLHL